jgi:hypothetical protein
VGGVGEEWGAGTCISLNCATQSLPRSSWGGGTRERVGERGNELDGLLLQRGECDSDESEGARWRALGQRVPILIQKAVVK